MGFYAGNNLMSCTSMEPKRWHDAIVKSLEFCIGFDTFMNPSIEASCDIFLPLRPSPSARARCSRTTPPAR